ncbi:unnamed protein product [Staurois parvus]|uniref:Uncharacterized protein n=1 Tax=Staurois parvus TaxID=386267 RepID=A0ABN9BEE2_9NEOB|nr:unnamed protein product [Staurois parvus]
MENKFAWTPRLNGSRSTWRKL